MNCRVLLNGLLPSRSLLIRLLILVLAASDISILANPHSPHFNHALQHIEPNDALGRSIRKGSPVTGPKGGTYSVFDPKFAKSELQATMIKYQQASQILRGIGLGPLVDLSPHLFQDAPVEEDVEWHNDDQAEFSSPSFDEVDESYGMDNQSSISSFLTSRDDASLLPPADSGSYPGVPPAPPPSPLNAGTGQLPLKALLTPSGLEILYYAQIAIGTPQQLLTVDFDTGSADAWIPVECWQCANKEFVPERSSTFSGDGDAFDVSYGSGDVSGVAAKDVFSLASLSVPNQTFGAVNSVSSEWNEYPNDGLIGLAYSTIAKSSEPTFSENLILQEKLAAPLFSVFLARGKEDGSSVCFGCWDPTKTDIRDNAIFWAPVVSKTYWSVLMDGFLINGQRVEVNLVAAIDTGTTLIYLPDIVAVSFYRLIPGAVPSAQYGPEFFTFPCSSTSLQISLSFNGRPLSLNLKDFNLGRTEPGSNDCVGGIVSLGKGFPSNLAIIGDEFLKSWYTTFDYSNGGRVGFAKSANGD